MRRIRLGLVILLFVVLSKAAFGQGIVDIARDEQDFTVFGAAKGDELGHAIATGDFNGDGIKDILVTAPNATNIGRGPTGAAYVIFGRADLPLEVNLATDRADVTILGIDRDDRLGSFVAGGDVNGDAIDDLVIIANGADGPRDGGRPGAGELYIILGKPDLPSLIDLSKAKPELVMYGRETGDGFGEWLALGDVNGDKVKDIIVGAPAASGPGNKRSRSGEVYILLGRFDFPDILDLATTAPDTIIFGADPGDRLGSSVATGDLDGDGLDEIILGAANSDGPANRRSLAGEVVILRGAPRLPAAIDLASVTPDSIIFGSKPGDRLGQRIVTGDVNKDRLMDIVMGLPNGAGPNNSRPSAGEIHVVFGKRTLLRTVDLATVRTDVTLFGKKAGDNFGGAIALADVNGDGAEDFLIGAPKADGPKGGRTAAGEAYIILGGTDLPATLDLEKTPAAVTVFGVDVGDGVGSAMADGDINGDGVGDMLIGAPLSAGSGNQHFRAGEIYAVFGVSVNRLPVADAGPDQTVNIGATVQLDGSKSSDPDGDRLRFKWRFVSRPAASKATLSDPNIVNPSFVADVAGDYVVQLEVNDGRGGTDTAQVRITATGVTKCDVDGDGRVTILDGRLIAEGVLGLRELTPQQREAGDVAPPIGVLDVADAQFLADVAVGLKECVPATSTQALQLSLKQTLNPMRRLQAVTFWVNEATEGLHIEIYDLRGKRVFNSGWVANGFQWALDFNRDMPVANGVYLYRVMAQKANGRLFVKTGKFVVLR